mgnify:CR=1 FL=1
MSQQVYKSTSKKIRVDTCDTRRQKSPSRRVAESMLKKINFISLDSEGERLYICGVKTQKK